VRAIVAATVRCHSHPRYPKTAIVVSAGLSQSIQALRRELWTVLVDALHDPEVGSDAVAVRIDKLEGHHVARARHTAAVFSPLLMFSVASHLCGAVLFALAYAYDYTDEKMRTYCDAKSTNDDQWERCIQHSRVNGTLIPIWCVIFFSLASWNLYIAAAAGDGFGALRVDMERAVVSRASARHFGAPGEVARHLHGLESASIICLAGTGLTTGSVTASIVVMLGSLLVALVPSLLS